MDYINAALTFVKVILALSVLLLPFLVPLAVFCLFYTIYSFIRWQRSTVEDSARATANLRAGIIITLVVGGYVGVLIVPALLL